jgi:hypothetical protein
MAARKGAQKRPDHERCVGRTRSGRRCRRKRAVGLETCPQHAENGAMGGRPTKLTVDVADRVVELLLAGALLDATAGAVGVSKGTIYAWLERGDRERDDFDAKADASHCEFRERVEQARAAAEEDAVRAVMAAAKGGDWRAAAWYLERAAPDRWAGPRRSAISTRDPGAPASAPETGGRPQLRVVNDQVGPDGRAL